MPDQLSRTPLRTVESAIMSLVRNWLMATPQFCDMVVVQRRLAS